ncbi:nitrile hydratase subunit alpha [Actinomycetospora sp. NBC_00405]|uniref:nitrile hydratase subunit alpha n=1 Tax=Actinomycetospora sp. NBC_00405 TaxID=2975952 RepID=UPI002E20997A
MSTTHDDGPLAARVRHVETLLEERGWLADGELDERIDAFAAGGSPANGAAIVARAWVDPGFRGRLLADASTAIEELGMSMAAGLQVQPLVAVANTDDEHHVVVCTLCSCYPVSLLGPSPTWYKSEAYRSRVVRDPRGVLREFGLELPDAVRITVWDASAETRYMVVPRRPEGTDGLSEQELAALVTRKGLIGTAAV